MASKTEMWAAFEHFNVSHLDHTFKRNPGLNFRQFNAEETPLLERPSRGRVESNPPTQPEATWAFHHRSVPFNEQRRGPMLRCRSAENCSLDKVTASLACDFFGCTGYEGRPMSKRRPGRFSPEATASATALTNTHVLGDFQSRGICDIDRNAKRGAGFERRAFATTIENEQEFSEEHHAELKSSLSMLTESTFHVLPEFVRDLGRLGIECRRLRASNFSQPRETLETKEHLYAHDSAEDQGRVREVSKKFTPVLGRENTSRLKQRTTSKEEKAKWADESNDLNINTHRLVSVYASGGVPHSKLPKHALSKSLKRLVGEASEKEHDAESSAETCSTIDEAPIDEVRCQIVGVELPKLDLRGLEKRTWSDASTGAASSHGTETPPSSPPCSPISNSATKTLFASKLSE